MDWTRATVMVVILMLPGMSMASDTVDSSGGWTQLRGGPAHAGVADLGSSTLDVVRVLDITTGVNDDTFVQYDASGLVWTPDGLIGMTFDAPQGEDRQCFLVRVGDLLTEEPEHYGAGTVCNDGAHLVAYDAHAHELIVCYDGQLPVAGTDHPVSGTVGLQGWSPDTGEILWSVAPTTNAVTQGDGNDNSDWFCGGIAIDEEARIAYVPWGSDEGHNRIEAIDLDARQAVWSIPIALSEFQAPTSGQNSCDPEIICTVADQGGRYVPVWVTLTDSGVAVMGQITASKTDSPSATRSDDVPQTRVTPASVWLSLDGRVVGSTVAEGSVTDASGIAPSPATASGSDVLAGQGALAGGLMGQEVIIIDPSSSSHQTIPLDVTPERNAIEFPPAWVGNQLVVPFDRSLFIVDTAGGGEPKKWAGFGGGTVGSVVVTPSGDAYVIVHREDPDGFLTDLVRIDLETGRATHRMPLPISQAIVRMTPLPELDGLLVWSAGGQTAVLAPTPAGAAPSISSTNHYPVVGEDVTIDVEVPAGAEVLVSWGDGLLEPYEGQPLVHSYDADRRHEIRATAVFEGGRTATAVLTMHVGESPPAELSWVQERFEPENQEVTFFALGIIFTLGGALIAVIGRRRRGRVLAAETAHLESLRGRGQRAPLDAAVALAEYRRTLTTGLQAGRFTDQQFGHLDRVCSEIFASLRHRLLSDIGTAMPAQLRARFDLAFADSVIDAAEAKDLLAGIKKAKSLSVQQRTGLKSLIEAWKITSTDVE